MKNTFEKLCQFSTLLEAWNFIKQKKSVGGIDGVSITEFDADLKKNLSILIKELKEKSWNPKPYLSLEIPKNETEKRKLGLLSIRDKVIQQGIRQLVEPEFEKIFLNNSYGYRANKGPKRAIERLRYELNNRKIKYVIKLDIENYFCIYELKTVLRHIWCT